MEKLHSMLRRQIKKKLKSADAVPEELKSFVEAVNIAYQDYDNRLGMLERAIELSSAELLQANEELNAIFKAIPDILFLLDSEAVILEVKAGSSSDLYLPPEELIGKRIYDLTSASVAKKFQEAIAQVRDGSPIVGIVYGLSIKGLENHYEARLMPFGGDQIVVIIRNISDAKRAEEDLEKTALFTNINPAPVLRLNRQGAILFANEGAKELFPDQELHEKSWYELFPETEPQIFHKLLRTKQSTFLEAAIDSKHFVFNIRPVPEYGFIHIYGTDISKRKEKEIENEEYLQRLERKSKFESIIHSVTASVHQSVNLDEVLENAVEALSNNIEKVEYAGIYFVEDDHAVLKAYRGWPDWFVERARKIPYPKGFTWKTIIDGETRYSPDTENDEFIGPAGREVGTKSYLSIPVIVDSAVIGTININSLEKDAFDEEERILLDTVAHQLSVAITNAWYFEELTRKTKFESIISSIQRSVHQSLDLDDVLENAVESLRANLDKAEYTGIYLVEDKYAVLKAYRGFPDFFVERAKNIPYPRGYTWKTIIEGKTRYSPDTENDEFIGPVGIKAGTKSYVCIPLGYHNDIIGAINVNSLEKDAFDEEELKVLDIVASQIEVAINNARQTEERKNLIEKLETALESVNLMQEELVVQEKLASLGALTAGIAHEIKNPLNFVNNFSELSAELLQELKEELQKQKEKIEAESYEEIEDIIGMIEENLGKINEHGKRADRVVHSMLQHSRGKSSDIHETDINTLLDDDINLAYHGMRARDDTFNVTIEKHFDEELGKIYIVSQDVGRVFLNILTNAFYETHKKFIQLGDGFVPKLIASTQDMGKEIEIRIRDNGSGIPKEVQDKIFNPFFTTKPPGSGTGLGLSLSYDIIVGEHKGRIKFATELGEFTEFIITLPKDLKTKKAAG